MIAEVLRPMAGMYLIGYGLFCALVGALVVIAAAREVA